MRAFIFRLETLLNLRKLERDEALSQYAKAISERKTSENMLSNAESKGFSIQELLRQKQKGSFSADEVFMLQSSYEKNLEIIKQRKADLSSKLTSEENFKKLFIDKDTALKSISRLREVKNEEHLQNERKKEDLELEDIINSRFSYLHNHQVF